MSKSYDINAYPIEVDELEARMRCFHDIKKHLICFKGSGWGWCDSDERDSTETLNDHDGFDTAWEAILDATEPYFEEDEE